MLKVEIAERDRCYEELLSSKLSLESKLEQTESQVVTAKLQLEQVYFAILGASY